MSEQGINWPWPRQVYAPIIEYVSQADALFIDILFTEPSSYGEEDDRILAEAMKKASNVYLPVFLSQKREIMSPTDEDFIKSISVVDKPSIFLNYSSAITPIDALKSSVAGAGNVTISPDDDGVYRRVPLFFGLKEYVIPNFVLSHILKQARVKIKQNSIYFDETKIPLTDGTLMLRYYRDRNPFKVFSASQILGSYLSSAASEDPEVKKDFFRGKIVFLGLTAAGLYDLKPTSISSVSTGVLIHATTLDNIVSSNFVRPLNRIFVVAFMLLISFFISYSVLRSYSLLKNLSMFISSLVVVLIILAILFRESVYMNIIPPITSLIFSFLISVAYSYATEGRQRLFLRATFSQYMDKKIADYIMENPSLIKPGGQIRRVTVFFADLAGFTSFAEVTSAEKVAVILHLVLNSLTEVLIRNQGVIDKYIGDSVMAFWGAPFDTEKDEVNACLSAIQCLKALDEINEGLRADGFSGLKVRIGIHTGEAIAGNIGSDRLFHYTVIGDTVNLASRLESANKFFKTSIIVSENTIMGTDDIFYKRELGSIAVKGKQLPVKIYELLGEKGNVESERQELLSVFQQGMLLYNDKKWAEAAQVFDDLLRQYPEDGPAEFYKRRCEYMISNPHLTEDWDVIKFTEK